MTSTPGTLFVVATPIGNLEDMSFRAVRVLREVALIAAEDTRHTAKLLSHFDIRTPTTSFFDQVEREKIPALLARLQAGEDVALVSDAGTPAVSDPGYRLVKAAIDSGIRVVPIPGASAVLATLVASGLPTDRFAFVGFPPPKAQARDKWLTDMGNRDETLIFFEAPHRIRETLAAALRLLGDREVSVGRELTKVHEEHLRGPISSVLSRLDVVRGEFTVALGPATEPVASRAPAEQVDETKIFEEFCLLTEKSTRREALAALAKRYGLPSRSIYAAVERQKAKTVQ